MRTADQASAQFMLTIERITRLRRDENGVGWIADTHTEVIESLA
jgi:hypothetical protein